MNINRPQKIGTGLMLFGLFLLFSAGGLLYYNVNESNKAEIQSQQILQEISAYYADENSTADKDFYIPDNLLASTSDQTMEAEQQPIWKTHPDIEMPTIEINGHRYIGTLSIPTLGLELPVMSQWDYPSLQISPCRYYGSVYKNNLVIAAHNYESHFGQIKTLNIGDAVSFTDADGNIFNYTVSDVLQLNPYDTEEMKSGDWDLTLFTCTIGGSYRVTVRCTLSD